MVGAFDHLHIVFDDNQGVPCFDQALEHAEQARDVIEMQARGRFVEKKKRRLGFGVREVGRQLEALRLTA